MMVGWRHAALILLGVPAVALAALGLVFTPVAASIPLLLLVPGLAGIAAFALATGHGGRGESKDDPGRWSTVRRPGVHLGLAVAGGTAAAMSMAAGLAVVAGAATGPLLLLAGFAAVPWAWPRLCGHLHHYLIARCGSGHGPIEPNPAPGERPLVRVLATLSTPALCREWQRSRQALATALDPATRDDIAELRRRYLDELERRDPAALTRWLATDSRPAGTNPARHLTTLEHARERGDHAPESRSPVLPRSSDQR